MNSSAELLLQVSQHTKIPENAALTALIRTVLDAHPNGVCAIIVYGSCLRTAEYYDGLVDLYVVVDSYRNFYQKWFHCFLNWLLPPNVFYIESKSEDRVVRAKYAVVSVKDFLKATSPRWFHSYFWGRFSQPAGLAFVQNDELRNTIYQGFAQSITTFCKRVIPQLPARFDVDELWQKGLVLSYSAELRVEKSARTEALFGNAEHYYRAVTPVAMKTMPYAVSHETKKSGPAFSTRLSKSYRLASLVAWRLRQVQGKLLSIARLLKGLITFHGGLDYIIWKLERHTGEKIEVSSRVRRYPAIFIWGLFWRLYWRGLFR